MIEPISLINRKQREDALKNANYNVFNLKSQDIFIDLLTDSGTGAMSQNQWASLMVGDESYANAKSFQRFEATIRKIFGFSEIIPAHQGRAAENILFGHLLQNKANQMVISNQSFDTTVGHILYNHAKPIDIVVPEGRDPKSQFPFKGNIDLNRLTELIENQRDEIAFITIVLTNNAGGGSPASMENIKAVSELAKTNGLKFYIDAARIIENAFFIKERERGYKDKCLNEIVLEICGLADGLWMSAKKDAYVNIGGFIALNDKELATHLRERLILFEGFSTYGGLAGRDLEAIATGLEEAIMTDAVKYRVNQIAYLVDQLKEAGIPVLTPAGGHAAFIDASEFLPHIPAEQFPAQSLACELYLEAGIRSVEIGSLMFGTHENGKFIPAIMELLRLTIPRRTYEKAHFDYIVEALKEIKKRKNEIKGLKITHEPELLRHFSCKLAPIV